MTQPFWARLAAWTINAVRTAVQALWAYVIAHVPPVAALLEQLTPDQQAALREWVVGVTMAAGIGAVAGLVHWLSSRTGDHWAARLARAVGNLMMVGLNRFMPAYADLRGANVKPASVNVYEVNAAGKMTGVQYEQPALRE